MNEIPIDALKLNVPIEMPLYHRTGTLLFKPGQKISPQHVAALQIANITHLHTASGPLDIARLKKSTGLRPLRVDALKVNQPLTQDICNDEAIILLSRNQIFDEQHRDTLRRRNITHVYISSAESIRELDIYNFQSTRHAADAIDKSVTAQPDKLSAPSNEPPFLLKLARIVQRTAQARKEIADLRASSCQQAGELLTSLRDSDKASSDIPHIVDSVLNGFTKDSNFLLKLATIVQQEGLNEDPRADHLINVCLNALAIGAHLHYSEPQMRRLGMCAFLHDIGMVRVPNDILLKPGLLQPLERLEVDRHTIHALDLLQKIPDIPEGTFLPIYQSHERVDGSGYPKGRRPPFIHEFARIIAIADTYAAVCSPRAHRSAKSPHQAMDATIRLAANNVFDKNLLRAFLHAVGLFPVGSWVLLSSGETARVIGTSNDSTRYDRPVVSVLFGRDGSPLQTPLILQLSELPELTITQVLPQDAFSTSNNDGF